MAGTRANRRAATLQDQIRGRPARTSNPINRQWMIGRDGSIYHYGFYDPEHRTLTSLSIYRLASNAWRLQGQTFAASASYNGGGWAGRNGWRQDLSTRPPKALQPFAQLPLALEPPDYFETEQADAELMTAAELRRYVNELSASGINVLSQSVELQRKFAFPLVTFVMTLLAIPFGVSAGRRGALYGIGLGIAIALSYWLLSSVFIAIGKAGVLTPLMAAWTPNIIVLACAAYLVLTART